MTQHPSRSRARFAIASIVSIVAAAFLLGACTSAEPTPTPTQPSSPTATAIPTATATPGGGGEVNGVAAPVDVQISGPLPDTEATVPPGSGELGRVSVHWEVDGSEAVDGFRIYQRDCTGEVVETPIEVGADERSYGPLQPCRPGGNIGVAAFVGMAESEVAWAP